MMRVMKGELRKLRRPTLFLSTLLITTGLSALVTSLLYLLIDSPRGNAREGRSVSPEILSLHTGVAFGFSSSAGLLGIVALCVFAAQTAQEYTYGTLRNILVREPRRFRVLVQKYLAMIVFALILVIFAAIISIVISYLLASGAGVTTNQWNTSAGHRAIVQALANVSYSTIGFGTFGMILGIILRSPISGISIGVIWTLIVEGLLSAIVKNIDRYLPGQLLTTVGSGGTASISYRYALTASALFLACGAFFAAMLFRRRDVAN